jgi:hypothetical protein
VERRLDSGGGIKKVEQKRYEVYPSVEPGKVYRRLVESDGRKLTEQELTQQDRKHEERSERRLSRHAGEDDETRKARLEGDTEKEREVVDEVFRMDDIRIAGRETIDGRPTIVVTFVPKPGYKPVTKGAKVIQKLDGRAWIDEQDKQLVRLEGRLLENVGVGPAKLARLQKGATAYFQRRKVNGEIWLPAEARFSGAAKVFLFFGGRLELQSRYSDYKKFLSGDGGVGHRGAGELTQLGLGPASGRGLPPPPHDATSVGLSRCEGAATGAALTTIQAPRAPAPTSPPSPASPPS